MNTSETVSTPDRRRFAGKVAIAVSLTIAAVIVLLVVGLTGYFRMGRDVKALRNSLMKSAAAEWDRKIELSVGSLTVNLARAGLSFVHLNAEARAALSALRAAEVGVYRLHEGSRDLDRAAMLSAADDAMTARGWDRVVGVMDRRNLVAVYVPGRTRSAQKAEVCVVVLDGLDLVLAAARTNLEPLLELSTSALRQKKRLSIGLPATAMQ